MRRDRQVKKRLRSIGSRIAISFGLLLTLLCSVAALTILSGQIVRTSFDRYNHASDASHRLANLAETAAAFQLAAARFVQTESEIDRTRAGAALAKLFGSPQSSSRRTGRGARQIGSPRRPPESSV